MGGSGRVRHIFGLIRKNQRKSFEHFPPGFGIREVKSFDPSAQGLSLVVVRHGLDSDMAKVQIICGFD